MTTPRKTTAARPKQPTAHFSIAAAEKELSASDIEAFTVAMKSGDVVTFRGPQEIGWQEFASLSEDSPHLFARTVVVEEDFEAFVREDFPTPVLRQLLAAYREHYGQFLDAGN